MSRRRDAARQRRIAAAVESGASLPATEQKLLPEYQQYPPLDSLRDAAGAAGRQQAHEAVYEFQQEQAEREELALLLYMNGEIDEAEYIVLVAPAA